MENKEKIITKYLNIVSKDIADVYYALRLAFIREGWSDKDLEKPPYYPNDIMRNFQRFSNEQNKLFFELKGIFDIDFTEFNEYLTVILQKIDDKTPLNKELNTTKNGN
ncbi:hypothetical protein OAA60_00380 [Porticoccaceae bacterium]|nr:hypothetical protein [bacterium]MDB4351868.1 hypothetical protein [Porticoccaceae bacterium]